MTHAVGSTSDMTDQFLDDGSYATAALVSVASIKIVQPSGSLFSQHRFYIRISTQTTSLFSFRWDWVFTYLEGYDDYE